MILKWLCAEYSRSGYLPIFSQVLDLLSICQQLLGWTLHSVVLFKILTMSWLPTEALQSQKIDFTCLQRAGITL